MFVETGVGRIIKRALEMMKELKTDDLEVLRKAGVIDLPFAALHQFLVLILSGFVWVGKLFKCSNVFRQWPERPSG